jgi:hypothetical protein
MTKQFTYSDWADDTLKVLPSLTYGASLDEPPAAPALVFVAANGPEVTVEGVRALRDHLTEWLNEHDSTTMEGATP